MKKILQALHPVDALAIVSLFFFALIYLVVVDGMFDRSVLLLANLGFTVVILLLAYSVERSPSNNVLRIIRDFYPVPMILIIFKEVHLITHAMKWEDIDATFIAMDRWMFGVDPTVWLMQFAHPVITELLQISYFSYYFIMLAVGVELYRKREHDKFSFVIFTIFYGFMLSYIGYILFPGVGPRFTLHDFATLDQELPGLFVSEALRDFINAGESIPKGVANAMALAQRDVFPSGHTEMTLISIYFAFKYRLKVRNWILVFGTLLIISTVYLRYHYVIDLIAGAVFMVFAVWTAPRLMRWWERLSKKSAQGLGT